MKDQKYVIIIEDLEKANSSDFLTWNENPSEPTLFNLEQAIQAISGSMSGLRSCGKMPHVFRYEVVPIKENDFGDPVYIVEGRGLSMTKKDLRKSTNIYKSCSL